MKIKPNIIVLVLTAFILMVNHNSYADISIDDMGFLLEDEADSAKEEDVSSDNKKTLDGSVIVEVEEKVKESKLTVESLSNKASDILHQNIVIVIIVGGVSLFFIIILYIFYAKIKKLTEQAQISKDLAEKYFYNIQEHRSGHEEIGKVTETKVSDIETDISDIITSVEKAFGKDTGEAAISNEKSKKIDDTDNSVVDGDIVIGSDEILDVDKDKVDSKENIVDQKELSDENKAEDKITEKTSETTAPETNAVDNLDVPATTANPKRINDIKKTEDSSDKDSKSKDNKDNELDVLDSLHDVGKSDENKTEGSETPSKEKDENIDTSGIDEINDIGIDIDNILKTELEDNKKDDKK
ncbi:MAG: hypothetical protein ACUZ8O_11265 [Candidatus Anammoxibacter sp.]